MTVAQSLGGIDDVAAALPLGRALGRVPGELVIIAVEAANLGLDEGLSAPVARAAPHVERAVLNELSRYGIRG